MAIDFDELNNFLRKSPMILSQADVLDWSETMTNDVKTKIHDGLKAGASYEDIEKSLHEHTMNAVKMSCYIMTNMASISDVSLPFMLGMDTKSLVNVYQDAKSVADNKGWCGQKRKSYIDTCLDENIIYKTYMADKCACMFFESGPDIMSGLAADCNTLASKYNVDVNEERAIDQVFHFTDDDDLRAAFVDNVKIHTFALPKRKTLNVLFDVDVDKQSTDDDALLLGMLCERYYDEHFAKMGFSSELKHYRPHMMASFLDTVDVSDADKIARYKKYRDVISVDEVYDLDAKVGYKSWDNSFRMFRYSDASFSDYCSDYGVGETSLKDRRYLEDAAYAQGRGLTASLQKNIFAGLNGENAGLDKVETCIAKTVDIGEDFLANMNAVSGIVGYGIKKAFRAAGDDRGYGYLLSGAIANARQKHLTPENTVKYVQKCGVANIIYNSAWAGMHGEPIQVMKGLGYSRLMSTADVQRYDISDEVAESIVNRFCKNKEAAQVFKNINDGTQDPFGGPQENQVRKELNVPVDDKDDDLEKSV